MLTLGSRVAKEVLDGAVLCHICSSFFLFVAKKGVDTLIESPLNHGQILSFAGGVEDGGSRLGVLVADVEHKGGTGMVKEAHEGSQVS